MEDSRDMVRLPAVVLAAGLSSRMGDFKPLMPLAGKPLVHHVIDSLRASGAIGDVVIVTGHQRQRVEHAVAGLAGVRVVFNPIFAEGEMLSSLRAGLAAIERAGPMPAAFFLAFADQPAVGPATIAALRKAFLAQPAVPLALPTHAGKRGHPILLSAALIPEIAALGENDTLRAVVHKHLASASLVEVGDPAVLEDLDTPEDFARAARRAGDSRGPR
jgi:CTP:molybdopterin cytidylyltransferase MocA